MLEQNGGEGATRSAGLPGPQDGFVISGGVDLGNGGAREGASSGGDGVYIRAVKVRSVVRSRVIEGQTTFDYRSTSDPFQMRFHEVA